MGAQFNRHADRKGYRQQYKTNILGGNQMDDATDSVSDDSDEEPVTDTIGEPKEGPDSTIDSIDGRRALPFSVPVVVVTFLVLYFTPVLEAVLGVGGMAAALDSGLKLLIAFFLAFGAGIFWEYIF
jgi:hypothetical protein